MRRTTFPLFVALVMVVLLAALSDPFMLLMPPAAAVTALLGAAVLTAVWAGFVLRERAADEREALHRLRAGRAAYLAGLAVLIAGVLFEGLHAHAIDPWLLCALGVMITGKIAASWWEERRG